MNRNSADARLVAERIAAAYEAHRDEFRRITRRARQRFARRDWAGWQQDALNRLLLYGHSVDETVARVREALGEAAGGEAGAALKRVYSAWCAGRRDVELTQTFYNSVVRRVYGVRGVRPELEYCGDELENADPGPPETVDVDLTDSRPPGTADADRLAAALHDLPLGAPLADPAADAQRVRDALAKELAKEGRTPRRLELFAPLFYRNRGAYAVGKVTSDDDASSPLLLALRHTPERGVYVDAALMTADEASIVFGFTRSYFQAELERPRAAVDFLAALMPHKRIDELYTSLGFHRHGKAELYRALMRALESDDARFETAPGEPGLVMTVFTLPSLNVVFKVMRDRFGAPKRITHAGVRDRYEFIFTRDRVGRLADAQEFQDLEFRRSSFTPEVLDELLSEASETVRGEDSRVYVDHVYTERRVTPLNLYLKDADEAAARAALFDYGNAIKELAAANIFPGDMLFKNFGVTRHGRVIFYDYDEVSYLTDCHFRRIPMPATEEEEFADGAWFYVADEDVFPEEFERFMALPGELGEPFKREHGDLFTLEFWLAMQEKQKAGELVEFFPYPEWRRWNHAQANR